MKIGFICWKQGGGTSDYVLPEGKSWLKDLVLKKGKYKGKISFEKALIATMEHKYKDIEIMFINKYDKTLLQQNDVNFVLSLNLLNAWESSKSEYNRVYKLMEDKTINIYPNLREQLFLYDKGKYLEYYKKNGIPIAPTFIIKTDRNVEKIIKRVKKEGWKSFVLKPYRAYATIGIGLFNTDDKDLEKAVSKYLTKNKKFPAFVCQQKIDGFSKFFEVKTYWINGKFRYYVSTHCWSWLENCESDSHIDVSHIKKVSQSVLKDIKSMGKKVVDLYPKMNKYSQPPFFLRIDFGCCIDNKMDGKNYFLNEIEYAGCGVLTEFSSASNPLDIWAREYYKKGKEIYNMIHKNKISVKTKKRKSNRRKK